MSEDFDREAEKERLREKLADDQESRKATEHMSDLLLKGATMTNHHCDACGDPIFRYDGQEFCPTCGETVDDGAASADSESAATDDGGRDVGDDAGTATTEAATEPATVDDSGEPIDDAGGTDAGTAARRGESPDESARSTGGAASRSPAADTRAPRKAGRPPDAPDRSPAAGDLGEARASLVRTLSDLAARAETAEDVRRTRDLLAAAHEAAETLAALDRADR